LFLEEENIHISLHKANPIKQLASKANIKSLLQYMAWVFGIITAVIAIYKFIKNIN
jgi:hypothetical protein